jgi:hypothetical protein
MAYLGYRPEDSTVRFSFTTTAAAGGAVAPSSAFEAADIIIYKDGSATQKTTTNGVTMTSPFDSVTGLHHVDIDTSNDTGDVGFWTAGSSYEVILAPDETVDGQTVVHVVGSFDLGPQPVNVSAIDGSSAAAVSLKQSCLSFPVLTVATAAGDANTAIAFDTNLTQENADYYGSADGGLVVAFVGTEANQYQTRRVVASVSVGANTRLTVEEAFDAVPSVGDVAILIGRISELTG